MFVKGEAMKRKYEKNYTERIGKILWEYNKEKGIHEGKLVGNKNGCQVSLFSTILILLRDLLRAHADGLIGCPYEYSERYGNAKFGTEEWAKKLNEIANKCDYCLKDDFHLSEDEEISWEEAEEKQLAALGEIMDWLKENLYTLWW